MTDAHKAALAAGRDDGRAVKAYLEALPSTSPKKRGRRRTQESIKRRLKAIEAELPAASALARLQLVQERRDLSADLGELEGATTGDIKALRKQFVAVAKRYSERKGIDYASWREVGVDPQTLNEAGISR